MREELISYSKMLDNIYDKFCLFPCDIKKEAIIMLVNLQERLQLMIQEAVKAADSSIIPLKAEPVETSTTPKYRRRKAKLKANSRAGNRKRKPSLDDEVASVKSENNSDTEDHIPDPPSVHRSPDDCDMDHSSMRQQITSKTKRGRPRGARTNKKQEPKPRRPPGRPSLVSAEYWDAVKEYVEQIPTESQEELSEITYEGSKADPIEDLGSTPTSERLDNHQKTTTEFSQAKKGIIFKCKLCDYKSRFKISAKSHMWNHHFQAMKPFACDICDSRFSKTSTLAAHKQTHVSERDHLCHICSYVTHSSHLLAQHLRIMHNPQRQLHCKLCDFTTIHSGSLDRHIKVHMNQKEYCCAECGRTFNSTSGLSRHKIIHSERNYKHECSMCGKKFPHPNKLRQHEAIHTGRRDFQCSECKYKSNTKGNLVKHLRLVHKLDIPKNQHRIGYMKAESLVLRDNKELAEMPHSGESMMSPTPTQVQQLIENSNFPLHKDVVLSPEPTQDATARVEICQVSQDSQIVLPQSQSEVGVETPVAEVQYSLAETNIEPVVVPHQYVASEEVPSGPSIILQAMSYPFWSSGDQ